MGGARSEVGVATGREGIGGGTSGEKVEPGNAEGQWGEVGLAGFGAR